MRSWMVLATVALALLVAEGSWAGGTAQRWDYVALGDSLPFGAGDVAGKSFVPRYARLIAQDTGASVAVHNFATETGTASGVLYQLQHDPSRKAVKGAEIVTISIGVNDLEAHFGEYLSKSCGGPDNQQCFRDALPRSRRRGTRFSPRSFVCEVRINPLSASRTTTTRSLGTFRPLPTSAKISSASSPLTFAS